MTSKVYKMAVKLKIISLKKSSVIRNWNFLLHYIQKFYFFKQHETHFSSAITSSKVLKKLPQSIFQESYDVLHELLQSIHFIFN